MRSAPAPLNAAQRRVAWLAFLAVAATRVWALSLTPWDWDEMLFSFGLVDFDVTIHHPHPPGFPLFILMGKILRPLVDSNFHALQGVNLIAAVGLFPAMLVLTRELRLRFQPALIASLLCVFFPPVWFYGGTAFSDVPSLTMVVLASGLLLRGCRSRGAYVAGAILLAVAVGIRGQNLLIGAVPALLSTWFRIRDRKRDVVLAVIAAGVIVAASYAGAAAATSSWADYREAIRKHREYITKIDSYQSPIRPSLLRVFDDFFMFQYGAAAINYFVSGFVLVSLLHFLFRPRRSLLIVMLMFVPFCVLAWLLLDHLSVTRFGIGYSPLFAVLAADGIMLSGMLQRLWRKEAARVAVPWIVASVLLLALVTWAAPAIQVARSTVSPPIAAVDWIRKNLDPSQARLYVDPGMVPFADYALASWNAEKVRDAGEAPILIGGARSEGWLLMEGNDPSGISFDRPRRRLYRIVRHRYFDVTVLPLRKAPRFRDGWYEPEGVGGKVWRWMGGRSETDLPPVSDPAVLVLTMGFPLDTLRRSPDVTVRLNGTVLDRFHADQDVVERRYEVHPVQRDVNRLVIETSETVNPEKRGIASDPRDLGLVLHELHWKAK